MATDLTYRSRRELLGEDDERVDVMRSLRGQIVATMVRQLIDASANTDKRPREATQDKPDSILALEGKAYSSLTSTQDFAGNATILPGGKSDSTVSWELHDTTLAHLLGTALYPRISPRRGKSAMADTLTELASYRWAASGFEKTAELLVSDARLRGTAGCKTFRDSSLGVARSSCIPTRNLIVDPSCNGDIDRTKYRGETTYVLRSELRRLLVDAWGKKREEAAVLAESAGRGNADYVQRADNPMQFLRRELETVAVHDFYWSDGLFRRHIILVEGIPEPVWDVDCWPYELPPGKWPINIFQWNPMPDTPWGASDFRLAQLWEESVSWMQRFLLDSTAEAAKVVSAFDPSIGDADRIQTMFGDLRISYTAIPLNLLNVSLAQQDITKLTHFFNTPTNAEKVQMALEFARDVTARSLGLDEMRGKLENPGLDPPRLARRQARWTKFLSTVLEAESCADITVIPQRALVLIQKKGNDPQTGKPVDVPERRAYMPLPDAETLERNSLSHAIKRGLTAEQWDGRATREKELRLKDGIDDESEVKILEPGIERYASRRMLVDYWEGGIPGVATRAPTEYVFQVKIAGSLESSDQAAQRAANALQLIAQLYNEWGIQESSKAWADQFKTAADANRQLESQGQRAKALPQPPKMLTNLLALHSDFVRASGLEDGGTMSLRPEDMAMALAQGKAMMDAQQAAMAEQQAAMQPQEDPRKLELELAKLQIELEKLALSKQKAEAEVAVEQIQAQTELLRQQHELMKQQVEEQRLRLEHEREMAELPFRMAQTQARTESTLAAARRSVAAAQTEILRAQQQENRAEIDSIVSQAEASVKMAEAELKMQQAKQIQDDAVAKANTPADTKEAVEIAEAQRLLSQVEEAKQKITTLKAEADKARAIADKERASAAQIRKETKAPPAPKKDKK